MAANARAIFDGGIPDPDASIILTEGEQKTIPGKKSILGILGIRGKVFNPPIAVLLPVEGMNRSKLKPRGAGSGEEKPTKHSLFILGIR